MRQTRTMSHLLRASLEIEPLDARTTPHTLRLGFTQPAAST